MLASQINPSAVLISTAALLASAVFYRVIYNLYFHPLSKFHGPWLAASTSLYNAVVCSFFKAEPQWLQGLAKKYGTDAPIRISPNMLLCPKPESIREIYLDPRLNQKSAILYDSGVLGPTQLFSTLDGDEHRVLRKALGGTQWSIGSIKNQWESRIDDVLKLFVSKMAEKAERGEEVQLGQKVAEFAADVMSMVVFNEPWGFVKNDRDERNILEHWRAGIFFYGFAARWTFLRTRLMKLPGLSKHLLPSTSNESGNGYLMAQADREVTKRREEMMQEAFEKKGDYLQHYLDARIDGEPLALSQAIANTTLLIQAGADTTGTALGSTLRFIFKNPHCLAEVLSELSLSSSSLSTPVAHNETLTHLPYTIACIKESLRLHPPAPQLLPRHLTFPKVINGHMIPVGTDVTTYSRVVQIDPELYPDPDVFRPERWLENEKEMESGMVAFGVGPRVCLGKEVSYVELYKVIPELIRRFDFELVSEGKHVVDGGIAWNEGFIVKPRVRV